MLRLRFCRIGVVVALFIAVSQLLHAGWMRTYGGVGFDAGRCVEQTDDGGYIVVGYKSREESEHWYRDLWLLKVDSLGNTLWTKTYGGEKSDLGYSVQQTNDGGYIITGYTDIPDDKMKVWLLKTDHKGDTLWTRTYEERNAKGLCVQQTKDRGYIVSGLVASGERRGVLLLKTDSLGDTLWTQTYGGEDGDWASYVQQTHDEGYIVVGTTFSFGKGWDDLWLIKTDSLGDTSWTRTYGGPWRDAGFCVRETSDGSFIVCGSLSLDSLDWGFPIAIWLLKTNSFGDTLWTRTYGGDARMYAMDCGYSVQEISDGGYIVSGVCPSLGGGLCLLKADSEGDTLWTRIYGEENDDIGYCVQQTDDGGYIITGSTESFGTGLSDLWLIKTDANGDTLAVVEPVTHVTHLDWEVISPIGHQITLRYADHAEGFAASFAVFNATGRKVDEIHAAGSSGTIQWGEGHGPGVYFIRVESGASRQTQKVVLIR